MQNKTKVTLIIFTWNEIDGMKVIMPQIKKEWYDQLIIVDGGSTDGTIEYAQANGYDIFVQKERGAGAAFLESFEKAEGDIIVIFSPDGNSVPEKIPELVAKIKQGYDIAIASRYLNGARSYDDDMVTAFGNKLFTGLMNILFKAGITDTLVMFRAYRRESLKRLSIKTKAVAWGTQIMARAARMKMKIGEIPGDEPARIGGVRKMNPIKNGIVELSMIITEFFRPVTDIDVGVITNHRHCQTKREYEILQK
ncbi:MAG: glycosyltransferase family 2 protein [Candidatus Omnitrophica bacterium]|nr:glycosyltransferase family 2 protein [Candidatus Omnitrophota bacterium]MCB9747289.1 glycosyltransferase family 2 protein [Candidatus Omnitrophota bacterium]